MRVFVAGASGAIGAALIPQLISAGHTVTAMTRSAQRGSRLRAMGAEPVVADALDRAAVMRVMVGARPEIVIHELTALAAVKDYKHFDTEYTLTNRLRTEGTDNLLAAARATGAQRFIAQSYGNYIYARSGGTVKTEEDALDPTPPANQAKSLQAIRYLEDAVTGVNDMAGIALRYGALYGPHTGFSTDGDVAALVRKRMFPIIGNGAGVWSFIHIEDAASATVAAASCGAPGVYNIVDDEPVPVSIWLPTYTRAIGAPAPLRIPVWAGRLILGDVGVSLMTQARGASNAKARRELQWVPSYATWREGFQKGLG